MYKKAHTGYLALILVNNKRAKLKPLNFSGNLHLLISKLQRLVQQFLAWACIQITLNPWRILTSKSHPYSDLVHVEQDLGLPGKIYSICFMWKHLGEICALLPSLPTRSGHWERTANRHSIPNHTARGYREIISIRRGSVISSCFRAKWVVLNLSLLA